jgi:hypothetical protein
VNGPLLWQLSLVQAIDEMRFADRICIWITLDIHGVYLAHLCEYGPSLDSPPSSEHNVGSALLRCTFAVLGGLREVT